MQSTIKRLAKRLAKQKEFSKYDANEIISNWYKEYRVPQRSPEQERPVVNHAVLAGITKGMTTQSWSRIRPELFDPWNVILIQTGVYCEALFDAMRGKPPVHNDPFPHIVQLGTNFYAEDGHTRIVLWRILGLERMPMRIYSTEITVEWFGD